MRNPGGDKRHWADKPAGKLVLGTVLPSLVIFVWWLGSKSGSAVIPSFGDVLRVLIHPFDTPADLHTRSLAFSILMTMLRLFIGFTLGIATAVPLGLWAGRNSVVDCIFYPVIQMARPLNPIVFLPIATVVFGMTSIATLFVGERGAWRHDILDQIQLAMIFILWWGAFFPVFLSTLRGVRSVRTSYIEAMTLLGATQRQIQRKVVLPSAMPYIANGMRIAMGVTWLVLLAAEIFPGTRSGLGYMLCTACKTSDYQYTFAAMIVIGIIGLVIDRLLYGFEKKTGSWQSAER